MKRQTKEKIWRFSMRCCHPFCHQKKDRSFTIFGFQFPLCARCSGVLIGYIIAQIYLLYYSYFPILIAGLLMLLMFIDWFVQYIKLKESTNRRRFITGILGGFGFSVFAYGFIIFVHDKII